MKPVHLIITAFTVVLFSCGNDSPPSGKDRLHAGDSSKQFSPDTAIQHPAALSWKATLPHYLILDKNGNVSDTLSASPPVLHPRSLTDKPVTFPEGLAALQDQAPDSVIVGCELVPLHWPQFKPSTDPSLFTKANTEKLFFFLSLIDSCRLYAEDCNYAMLRFLRYKTLTESLKTKKLNGREEYVNIVSKSTIRWDKPLHALLIGYNQHFAVNFNQWYEFWACGAKADYAPQYGRINVPRIAVVEPDPYPDNFTHDQLGDYYEHQMNDPVFMFSVLKLSDTEHNIADSLDAAQSRDASLVTTDGKVIKGKGIDLNKDNRIDAFWYVDKLNGYGADKDYPGWKMTMSWVVRLYLKIDGQWVPLWYRHCDFGA